MSWLSPHSVVRSISFYPLSLLYAVAVGLVVMVALNVLSIVAAVLILTLAALFALLYATWRELKAVHKLVDGQRSELVARIDELTALLVSSGVVVPPSGEKEQDARADVRREQERR